MIAGHEGISGGEVRIGDAVMNALPPARRPTAMMFQSYALFPHLDCLPRSCPAASSSASRWPAP